MRILARLLNELPSYKVMDVRIGLHWSAVTVDAGDRIQCGLAATLHTSNEHPSEQDIPEAGSLNSLNSDGLASWVLGDHPVQASVGLAALNASLPPQPHTWQDVNAEDVIARHGAGRKVALVGHFPFVDRLKKRVGRLYILEQQPRPGDYPAEAAQELIPQADVVAITGMTLSNHTLEGLLALCHPDSLVILLGPSTPLSPILFDFGIDWLSGAVVTKVEPVLQAVSQAANFRQLHKLGVKLVNIARPGIENL